MCLMQRSFRPCQKKMYLPDPPHNFEHFLFCFKVVVLYKYFLNFNKGQVLLTLNSSCISSIYKQIILCIFRDCQSHQFKGIKNNLQFANAIKKSFANQTMTLAKTMDEERENLTYHCTSCNVSQAGEKGEYICSHCGGEMNLEGRGNQFSVFL